MIILTQQEVADLKSYIANIPFKLAEPVMDFIRAKEQEQQQKIKDDAEATS